MAVQIVVAKSIVTHSEGNRRPLSNAKLVDEPRPRSDH